MKADDSFALEWSLKHLMNRAEILALMSLAVLRATPGNGIGHLVLSKVVFLRFHRYVEAMSLNSGFTTSNI